MKPLEGLLNSRIVGAENYTWITRTIAGITPWDVEEYLLEGLSRVSQVVIAKPFTRYAWLLAVYNSLGKLHGDKLIVYYNSEEPLWTVAVLVHEAIHSALNIKHTSILDIVVDETLAYTATFKAQALRSLYRSGTASAVQTLSQCTSPYTPHSVAYIIAPRILAHRLTSYDYRYLAQNLEQNPLNTFKLWLETRPPRNEARALTAALYTLGLENIARGIGVEEECRQVLATGNTTTQGHILEGVDKYYMEMLGILRRAVESGENYQEYLKPWWNEIREIMDEIEALIELYMIAKRERTTLDLGSVF